MVTIHRYEESVQTVKDINKPSIYLAGGDWEVIERIISEVFAGEYVTIVNYVP